MTIFRTHHLNVGSHFAAVVLIIRLLYFMVMKNRNCLQLMAPGTMSLASTIYTLCALILAERNLIVEMNVPNALKDLFIEQSESHSTILI